MKKVLIGTTNPSKVRRFEALLSEYDIEFYTLKDLHITGEPEEKGSTPKENAIFKAKYYGKYFHTVICNDSGLYFDGLELNDKRQPGLNIRTPNGCRRLNDEEMIEFYSKLVNSLGGKVLAYYLDGIAVYNHKTIYSFMENREAAKNSAFYMIDAPSPKRQEGWPLDSLSLNKDTLRYFVDEENNEDGTQDEELIVGEYKKRLINFLVNALGL